MQPPRASTPGPRLGVASSLQRTSPTPYTDSVRLRRSGQAATITQPLEHPPRLLATRTATRATHLDRSAGPAGAPPRAKVWADVTTASAWRFVHNGVGPLANAETRPRDDLAASEAILGSTASSRLLQQQRTATAAADRRYHSWRRRMEDHTLPLLHGDLDDPALPRTSADRVLVASRRHGAGDAPRAATPAATAPRPASTLPPSMVLCRSTHRRDAAARAAAHVAGLFSRDAEGRQRLLDAALPDGPPPEVDPPISPGRVRPRRAHALTQRNVAVAGPSGTALDEARMERCDGAHTVKQATAEWVVAQAVQDDDQAPDGLPPATAAFDFPSPPAAFATGCRPHPADAAALAEVPEALLVGDAHAAGPATLRRLSRLLVEHLEHLDEEAASGSHGSEPREGDGSLSGSAAALPAALSRFQFGASQSTSPSSSRRGSRRESVVSVGSAVAWSAGDRRSVTAADTDVEAEPRRGEGRGEDRAQGRPEGKRNVTFLGAGSTPPRTAAVGPQCASERLEAPTSAPDVARVCMLVAPEAARSMEASTSTRSPLGPPPVLKDERSPSGADAMGQRRFADSRRRRTSSVSLDVLSQTSAPDVGARDEDDVPAALADPAGTYLDGLDAALAEQGLPPFSFHLPCSPDGVAELEDDEVCDAAAIADAAGDATPEPIPAVAVVQSGSDGSASDTESVAFAADGDDFPQGPTRALLRDGAFDTALQRLLDTPIATPAGVVRQHARVREVVRAFETAALRFVEANTLAVLTNHSNGQRTQHRGVLYTVVDGGERLTSVGSVENSFRSAASDLSASTPRRLKPASSAKPNVGQKVAAGERVAIGAIMREWWLHASDRQSMLAPPGAAPTATSRLRLPLTCSVTTAGATVVCTAALPDDLRPVDLGAHSVPASVERALCSAARALRLHHGVVAARGSPADTGAWAGLGATADEERESRAALVLLTRHLDVRYSATAGAHYLTRCATVLPPAPPNAAASRAARAHLGAEEELLRLPLRLRPEACALSPELLSGDAFTLVAQRPHDDRVMCGRALAQARVLRAGKRVTFRQLRAVMVELSDPGHAAPLTGAHLCHGLHQAGVNLRFLGVAAEFLADRARALRAHGAGSQQEVESLEAALAVVRQEMALRVFRSLLRGALRDVARRVGEQCPSALDSVPFFQQGPRLTFTGDDGASLSDSDSDVSSASSSGVRAIGRAASRRRSTVAAAKSSFSRRASSHAARPMMEQRRVLDGRLCAKATELVRALLGPEKDSVTGRLWVHELVPAVREKYGFGGSLARDDLATGAALRRLEELCGLRFGARKGSTAAAPDPAKRRRSVALSGAAGAERGFASVGSVLRAEIVLDRACVVPAVEAVEPKLHPAALPPPHPVALDDFEPHEAYLDAAAAVHRWWVAPVLPDTAATAALDVTGAAGERRAVAHRRRLRAKDRGFDAWACGRARRVASLCTGPTQHHRGTTAEEPVPPWLELGLSRPYRALHAALVAAAGEAHHPAAERALRSLLEHHRQSAEICHGGWATVAPLCAVAELYVVQRRFADARATFEAALGAELHHGRGPGSPLVVQVLGRVAEAARDMGAHPDFIGLTEAALASLLGGLHRACQDPASRWLLRRLFDGRSRLGAVTAAAQRGLRLCTRLPADAVPELHRLAEALPLLYGVAEDREWPALAAARSSTVPHSSEGPAQGRRRSVAAVAANRIVDITAGAEVLAANGRGLVLAAVDTGPTDSASGAPPRQPAVAAVTSAGLMEPGAVPAGPGLPVLLTASFLHALCAVRLAADEGIFAHRLARRAAGITASAADAQPARRQSSEAPQSPVRAGSEAGGSLAQLVARAATVCRANAQVLQAAAKRSSTDAVPTKQQSQRLLARDRRATIRL